MVDMSQTGELSIMSVKGGELWNEWVAIRTKICSWDPIERVLQRAQ